MIYVDNFKIRADMKKIEITCSGASLMDLDELIAIQGNLKDLSKENYLKLKKSILKHGFAFPFHAWKSPDGLKILDGTQRQRTLRSMRDEGYYIPKLPVDFIHAKDEKEAKELILANISEYGNMTGQGLLLKNKMLLDLYFVQHQHR